MDRKELEEKLRRKRLAKYRFKTLCRKIVSNSYWLSAIEDTSIGSNPRRNINIIFRRSGKMGILSLSEKSMFNTPDECRSSEVKEKLKSIIMSLHCFQMIPSEIRETLASKCNFLYVRPQKVILREGHPASALYFILHGEITVSKRAYSLEVGGWIDDVLYALVPGDVFGIDGLIFGNKRAVTCTAAADTELLFIRKADLSYQLRTTLKQQWEQIKLALKRFDYCFGHFTEQQYMECCTFSRIRQYHLDEVIHDKDDGDRSTVFFLLSGKCMILQYLNIKCKSRNNNKFFTLLGADEVDSSTIESTDKPDMLTKMVDAFMDVGTLSSGSIFGLGENMVNRSIIAKNVVQCLEIPRFWLSQRSQNIGNIWERTKNFYNQTIPSREMVFRDFVKSNKWDEYKSKIVDGLNLKAKL